MYGKTPSGLQNGIKPMGEFNGRIANISISYGSGKPVVSFEADGDKQSLFQMFESYKGMEDLRIKVSKAAKKRSLDANSYYWLLLNKLAKVLKISNNFCHNLMLRRYGTLEEFDGQTVYWVIPDTDEASRKADEAETYHIKPTSQVKEGNDGQMYRTYILLKGSHSYNKEEFRSLLEGLIDECKYMGIETQYEADIQSLMNTYKER